MSDELHAEIPLAPQDEHDTQSRAAPPSMSLADADRKKLKALLRELLRDSSVRELLCRDDALTPQFQHGE